MSRAEDAGSTCEFREPGTNAITDLFFRFARLDIQIKRFVRANRREKVQGVGRTRFLIPAFSAAYATPLSRKSPWLLEDWVLLEGLYELDLLSVLLEP